MALRTFVGGGTFAHLLGRSKAASGKSKAEDDASETDEERRKRERRERDEAKASSDEPGKDDGDDKDKDEKSKASGSKADREDEDMDEADDVRKEDEEEDEHDPDEVDERNSAGRKSRRAKASDDEDEAADTRSAGRKAERDRGAAIFASPAAALRPDLAAHLAFKTNLSTRAAIDTLAAMAAGELDARSAARHGIANRMSREPNPDVGQEDQRPAQRRASLGDRVAALQKKIGAA